MGWPVAFIAAAYFAAALATLLIHRSRPLPRILRLASIPPALLSLVYLCVIAVTGLLCPYCLAAHLASLTLAAVLLTSPRNAPPVRASAFAIAFPLVLFTAVLATTLSLRHHAVQTAATGERSKAEESIKQIAAAPAGRRAFVTRFVRGDENARCRIVVFSDYQCPECRQFDAMLDEFTTLPGVSIAMKHFPFCRECNPRSPVDFHPSACRAAQAAQAAGLVHGRDAFWTVHRWLFDRKGDFERSDLGAFLRSRSLDPAPVLAALNSPAVLDAICADADEAFAAGFVRTPMVFINGVELRGLFVPGALRAAVDAALASPQPDDAQPPAAEQKFIADWLAQPVLPDPAGPAPRALGSPAPRIDVVLFGDYQNPATLELNAFFREQLTLRADLRYSFRHFPFDPACNPAATRNASPVACRMHTAVQAVQLLSGDAAFWTAHEWMLANQRAFSPGSFRVYAQDQLGIDPQALASALASDQVKAAITADTVAGAAFHLPEVPCLIINGRIVPRWKHGDTNILPALLASLP